MFALARTRWGFRLKMLGMNPNAARAAGVSMAAVGGGALVMSGAFAGLAGGVVFAGTAFRIQPGYSAKDRKSTRLNPVTNAHLVCRLLLENKNTNEDVYD